MRVMMDTLIQAVGGYGSPGAILLILPLTGAAIWLCGMALLLPLRLFVWLAGDE